MNLRKGGTHRHSTQLTQILPLLGPVWQVHNLPSWAMKNSITCMLHILFNDWEKIWLVLKQFQSTCTKLELSSDFLFYRVYPVFSIAGAQHITFQDHFLQIRSGFSHTLSEWRLSCGTPTSAAPTMAKQSAPFRVQPDATWRHARDFLHTPKSVKSVTLKR